MTLKETNGYYDNYSRAIENGEIEADPSTIRQDRNGALKLVLVATGASNSEEALALFNPGRPPLDC